MSAMRPTVCWDRTETEVFGVFWPAKSLQWVRRQLNYFHSVLIACVRGIETADPDPTAAALGVLYVRGRPDSPPFTAMYSVLRGVWPLPPETTERQRQTLGPDYLPEVGHADHARAQWLWETFDGLCAVTRSAAA